MSKVILIMGSVTSAARLKKAAESLGATEAEVIHTPSELTGKSCSYSVKLNQKNLGIATKASQELGIKIKKVYIENVFDKEKVYHDIS